jgi:solute carrier family 13 (sodium-dependent dicarboxylate transporter), member 2/3/5
MTVIHFPHRPGGAGTPAPAPDPASAPCRPLRTVAGIALATALLLGLWAARASWSADALAVLGVTGLALIAWTVLRWDEVTVAVTAALALVALGAIEPKALYTSLGHDLVWLLIGGFVLGVVLRHSGLAERAVIAMTADATSTTGLLHRLTFVIGATAFLIPSTSGRAALLLPVFLALVPSLPSPRHVQAVALLFPTIVLLSAGASLLGAGAHLVAVDFLRRLGLPAPGFGGWLLWAGPLSMLACAMA